MPKDTLTLLLITAIFVLSLVEAICGWRLTVILKQISEEKTDNRRAFFRKRAYGEKEEARALKAARDNIWKDLRKGRL